MNLGNIVNRMGVALLGKDCQVDKYEIIKAGALSSAGAARLYINDEITGELFIPVFSQTIGTDNFYDYALCQIRTDVSELGRGNLTGYIHEMEKITEPSPIKAAKYFKKSTCMNILGKYNGKGNMYLFAARDNLENYSLYTVEDNEDYAPRSVNYCGVQKQTCLTYPYYFCMDDNQYLLVSTGRYGNTGLSMASIELT